VLLDALPLTPNGKLDRKALPMPLPSRFTDPSFHAPRDGVEQQLAAIWMELLRLPTISIHANFFALGGHSLLAVRLMSAIRQRFDCHLPLATLFTHPTIAHLARELRQGATGSAWTSLVPIQPHGSRPPFFCIHPAGGNVLQFYGLAQHLGAEQPFYALQSIGLDGVTPPDSTIEAMAERYAAQILTVQPSGPYWLGGYSLGGTVAYAVAHALRRAGHQVARVVILDTAAPGTLQDPDWLNWSDAQWLLGLTETLEAEFGEVTQRLRQDGEWLTLPFDEQLR